MPAVSVVMAVKNGEATIRRAVNSIINQGFSDFELLIADDYSTDSTTNILQQLANNDHRIKPLKANRTGLVPALNQALAQARGHLIARMDADDESMPNRLALQVDTFNRMPAIDVVSGLVLHTPTQKNQQGYAYHVQRINQITTPKEHFVSRFQDAPLANPASMFKKELLNEHGLYQAFDGPEDYEFWLRLLARHKQFYKPKQPVLRWYDYPTRLTRTHSNYSLQAFAKLKARYFADAYKQASPLPEIWVWGYGKEVFQKSKYLAAFGLSIAGYIDVKPRPNSQRTVVSYRQLTPNKHFVLVYVSDRTGQLKICNWLLNNGFIEGTHFYFMV